MTDLTKIFSNFVSQATLQNFNDEMIFFSKMSMIDWCGVAYAAKEEPVSKIVTKLIDEEQTKGLSRLISNGRVHSKKMTAFDFYGPTCDSLDYMKGPFILPNNVKENDYIELGQLGAYGLTFRTQFNGFYSNEIYEVEDEPIMTMYDRDKNKGSLVA